jgi:hypothetical protein
VEQLRRQEEADLKKKMNDKKAKQEAEKNYRVHCLLLKQE